MATPEENRAQYDKDFADAQSKFEATVVDLNSQHTKAEETLTTDLESAQARFVASQEAIDPALVPTPEVPVGEVTPASTESSTTSEGNPALSDGQAIEPAVEATPPVTDAVAPDATSGSTTEESTEPVAIAGEPDEVETAPQA